MKLCPIVEHQRNLDHAEATILSSPATEAESGNVPTEIICENAAEWKKIQENE